MEKRKDTDEERIITVATFENPVKAYLAKETLEASGIACFLKDENMVQLYPMFHSPFGGIKLCIMQKDEQAAIEILKDNNIE